MKALTWKWAAAIWPPWPNFLESAGMTASQQTDWTPPAPFRSVFYRRHAAGLQSWPGNFKSPAKVSVKPTTDLR